MDETPKCNRCGAPLPADSPEGLCPRCLMALNLATQTDIPGEPGAAKPPPAPPLPVADVAKLFPQLEILECLGRGGMGAVYKARQPRLDRLVALKILSPEKQGNQKFAERFEREARALAKLHHPNIVTVYDFGEAQGNFYLLMEFVDGLTLRQLLQARKLSPTEALAIVPKICEALQYAHEQGIVHRDIKPENILVDKNGRLKIADFGIAKILGSGGRDNLTDEQSLGTPHYMSPEQIEKPQSVDHRADIYSLGVVFYEMLTGELPLGKFQPPSKKVHIDVRLDEIVLRALEKEPERRYQQASEVKTRVEAVAAAPLSGRGRREEAQIENLSRKPDHFWRKFAIVVVLLISIPFLIAILGLLAAIAIPNFVKARQHALALRQQQIAASADYSANIHVRVFEADAGLVDKWIPSTERQKGILSDAPYPGHSTSGTYIYYGDFAATKPGAQGTNYQIANIDSDTLAALLDSLPAKPGLLVNQRSTVPFSWWDQGDSASWGYTYSDGGFTTAGGAGGFWGFTSKDGVLQARLSIITTQILPGIRSAPPPNDIYSKIFYEGNAPQTGALVFLVPFSLEGSPRYLITAFEFQQRDANGPSLIKSDYIGQTWFPYGDSIQITSVERTEDQITVKGHYNLVSRDTATLMLFITPSNHVPTRVYPQPQQEMKILKGSGDFELTATHVVPSLPQVSMQGDRSSFGLVYFGTREEATEEARADWIPHSSPFSTNELHTVTIIALYRPDSPGLPDWAAKGLADEAAKRPNNGNDFVIAIKEWIPGVENQLRTFQGHCPRDFLLTAPQHPEIRIHLTSLDMSAGNGSFQGFGAQIDPQDKDKLASGVAYSIQPINTSDTYQWTVAPGVSIVPQTSTSTEPQPGDPDDLREARITKEVEDQLAEAKTHLADLSADHVEQNRQVQVAVSQIKEVEQQLNEAKTHLAELRVDHAEQSLDVQSQQAAVYELDQKLWGALQELESANIQAQAGEPADLRIARVKLYELRLTDGEQNPEVQAQLARINELERMSKEEPDASPELREAKAHLAEMHFYHGEQSPDVQAQLARIKELERMSKEEPDASPELREAKAHLAEMRNYLGEQNPALQAQQARVDALESVSGESSPGIYSLDDSVLNFQPPVVVETYPVSGARDVTPGETEIRVRFSKDMMDGSWSWSSAGENSTPDFIGSPRYESDSRTCVAKVKLEPGRTYAFWLNSAKFHGFKDADGRPAIPYLLIFQTEKSPAANDSSAPVNINRPRVISFWPSNGAANVNAMSPIAIRFDRAMDPGNVDIGWRSGGFLACSQPQYNPTVHDFTFALKLLPGATNALYIGNPGWAEEGFRTPDVVFAGATNWQFTTKPLATKLDASRPRLVKVSPASGKTMSVLTLLQVTFDRPMTLNYGFPFLRQEGMPQELPCLIPDIKLDSAGTTFTIPVLLPPDNETKLVLKGFYSADGVKSDLVIVRCDIGTNDYSSAQMDEISSAAKDPRLIKLLSGMKAARERLASGVETVETTSLTPGYFDSRAAFGGIRISPAIFKWQGTNQFYEDISGPMNMNNFILGTDGQACWMYADDPENGRRLDSCPADSVADISASIADPFSLARCTVQAAIAKGKLIYEGQAQLDGRACERIGTWIVRQPQNKYDRAFAARMDWWIDSETFLPVQLVQSNPYLREICTFHFDGLNQPLPVSAFQPPGEGKTDDWYEKPLGSGEKRFLTIQDGGDGRMVGQIGRRGPNGSTDSGMN